MYNFYLAPMEGITGYVYRNAHMSSFPGITKYYTPFVVANYTGTFKGKERADLLPENNVASDGRNVPIVPQILSNRSAEFLHAANFMADLGYSEVNLNLGCPVGTVAAKKKGSGFLSCPDELDRFLDEIFEGIRFVTCTDCSGVSKPLNISVKTRIGYASPSEAEELIKLYNRYPISELTVHPRTKAEFYNGQPHIEVFEAFLENAQNPLIYNGNIMSVNDYKRFAARFPQEKYPLLKGVMVGRGLIADPALVCRILASKDSSCIEPHLQEGSDKSSPLSGDLSALINRVGQNLLDSCTSDISPFRLDVHWPANKNSCKHDFCLPAYCTKKELRNFHEVLYNGYKVQYSDFRRRRHGGITVGKPAQTVLINRMKEVWSYMSGIFSDSDQYLKNIRKADSLIEYESAVRVLFNNCELTAHKDGLLPSH